MTVTRKYRYGTLRGRRFETFAARAGEFILIAMATWKIIPMDGSGHSVTADSIEMSADGATVRFAIRAPGLGSIVTVALVTTTPGMLIVNADHKTA